MNRQHVYRLIDAERERQGIEWGGMQLIQVAAVAVAWLEGME